VSVSKNSPRLDQFNSYFFSCYGERWESLRAALLDQAPKFQLRNPFGNELSDYSLDPASLYPVQYLSVEPGDHIADFCASPGGKSLAMIFAVKGEAHWFCNDLSPGRVARLKAVMHDCLPAQVRERVHITQSDASRWGLKRKEHFNRILVDAPCSGERHLMNSPKELARWSLKGAKRLVIRQNALLCSAMDCLKPGGRLVYSTCSINPIENDGVIERLMKSRAGVFEIVTVAGAEKGEPTRHGWQLLPDKDGCGPIYFSVMRKLERTD
jgi:16S rRNA C967 or C1407 C5-methylase (RsmB/RsmF family)